MRIQYVLATCLLMILSATFNNCGKVKFEAQPMNSAIGKLDENTNSGTQVDPVNQDGGVESSVIMPVPIKDITPLVQKAGVVTILLALGDQIDNQLVVKGSSSKLIAQTVVRYASPVRNPRILVVRDINHYGESAYDSQFIAETLLAEYDAEFRDEPTGGLAPAMLEGYDLIWFNNPGHEMSQLRTKQTLLSFRGGVVLSGDDMSRGVGFSMTDLTGLRNINNGESVVCAGNYYSHDNNNGSKYSVSIEENKIPGVDSELLRFQYGNDIDEAVTIDSTSSRTIEVLAYAVGGNGACTAKRPTIVRYEK